MNRDYIFVPPSKPQPPIKIKGYLWECLSGWLMILGGIAVGIFGLWSMVEAVEIAEHARNQMGECLKSAGFIGLGFSLPVAGGALALFGFFRVVDSLPTTVIIFGGLVLLIFPPGVWLWGISHHWWGAGVVGFVCIILPCIVIGACAVGFPLQWLLEDKGWW